jgi:uncharacterized GH25 family protein
LLPAVAVAHYASLTVSNYHPEPGEQIIATIGFGHNFPSDGRMRRAAYEHVNLVVIDPDGKASPINVIPGGDRGNEPIHLSFEKKGCHILVLSMKHFTSKTTTGYKYQPRNELNDVLYSKWSETVSKAVINVGAPKTSAKGIQTKDRFQVVALEDAGVVPKDGYLPVKITLDEKPWSGRVYATYAGFSDRSDTFAYTTKTDKEGVAEIRMLQKGIWLIYADHEYPHENETLADNYSLRATLTLEH